MRPSQILRILADITGGDHRFLDANLRKTERFIYHALAIDENREIFDATLLTVYFPKNEPFVDPRDFANVEQRWFCGSHGNVGGGNYSDIAAQIPLQWLMTKAQQRGLSFRLEKIDIEPNAASAALYDSFKANDIPDLLQQILLQHGSRYWREIDRPPETRKVTIVHTVMKPSTSQSSRGAAPTRPISLQIWSIGLPSTKLSLRTFRLPCERADPAVAAPE